MKRLLVPMLVAALAFIGVSTPTAQADAASQRGNAATIAALFDAHNALRAERDLPALKLVPKVAAEIAQPWTLTMQEEREISHNSDFRWPGATAWGENVGHSIGFDDPVASLMEGWMDSPGHRANILEKSYEYISVGATLVGSELYSTVNFYQGPLTDGGPAFDSGAQWLAAVTNNIDATAPAVTDDVYTKAGIYALNNRLWRVTCEAYSQTSRCRTEIWATVISYQNRAFQRSTGWAFNNLTYLPAPRALWTGNPLATTGDHTISGRQWRTECDTAATGRNGCRSYILTAVITATPSDGGGYTFTTKDDYVFNNMVRFR